MGCGCSSCCPPKNNAIVEPESNYKQQQLEQEQRLKQKQQQEEEQRLKQKQQQEEEQRLKQKQQQEEEQRLKQKQQQEEEQRLKQKQQQEEEQRLKQQQQQQQPPEAEKNQAKQQSTLLAASGVDNIEKLIDKCPSAKDVTDALRKAGLNGCSLIFGIDYTLSNNSQGKRTFGGKPLHKIEAKILNPYQQVITYLGETVEPLDKDGLIPVFGFGDAKTKGSDVFPLKANGLCRGCKEVLATYAAVTPTVDLSGPTNFAPLIRKAIDIVKKTKSYCILVIIADGQVTSEKETIDAIVAASAYPLSIVMVGVGDGPWDDMQKFDERIPRRQFDNFQFVDFFTTVASQNARACFALKTLMEVPDQFKRIGELNLYANCK